MGLGDVKTRSGNRVELLIQVFMQLIPKNAKFRPVPNQRLKYLFHAWTHELGELFMILLELFSCFNSGSNYIAVLM
jgi:hypothetical protein